MGASPNEWDEYADGWDSDAAARTYASEAAASLQSTLSSFEIGLDGARVVDFGCGTGLLTERLVEGGAQVTAVDRSRAMLDVLDRKVAERGWTSVRTTDTTSGLTHGFDLVVCSSVCSFVDDYPATVAELVDVLRPGGVFVQWDWEREADADDGGLTRSEISDALAQVGLVDTLVETAFAVSMFGETMRPLIGRGRRPTD